MTAIIVTEKPSAARQMAAALGGMQGNFGGTDYRITHLRGHLYEHAAPEDMVDPSLKQRYHQWDVSNLPWDVSQLSFARVPRADAKPIIAQVKAAIASGEEIVVATDLDPTGEGDLIFWEVIDELGFHDKRFSRMEFVDESAPSLRQAFTQRRAITTMADEPAYRKAEHRARWDLLSMQFTRIATAVAREHGSSQVLRQGRLKSAMVVLVGDGLKAHNDYVRKPFFQSRFRDENGVVYTNPDEPRFDTQAAAPQQYSSSDVVALGVDEKYTAPPKLVNLAKLSSLLARKGIKAAATLQTYQRMYEAKLVSYPRTEDATITPEQFKELAPLVDQIAAVVGVDPSLLSHRGPRSSHVKPTGAHGANRPGTVVPASLEAVKSQYGEIGRMIYETLARSYLAMLAPDYEYQLHRGRVKDYPDFVGTAHVPLKPGWKAVFDPDAGKNAHGEDVEDDTTLAGLGTWAEPFVHEGANTRPPHPSMDWLMAQLDKRKVGTAATQVSTYAEVTSSKARYPLLAESGRKLVLAEAGSMSWYLLANTHIGDLGTTERVYEQMRQVAEGTLDSEAALAGVAQLVEQDIVTMQANAAQMAQSLNLTRTPRATGVWVGAPGGPREVRFKAVFSGHTFTEDEIKALLADEVISFPATNTQGKGYTARGKLQVSTYQGRKYVGFGFVREDKPTTWCKHTFTDEEVKALLAGQTVAADDFVGSSGKAFSCEVSWDVQKKQIVPDFGDSEDSAPPRSWCGHTFTEDERAALALGKSVHADDFISKAGKTFSTSVSWKLVAGKKKIVPEFGVSAGGPQGGSGPKRSRPSKR